MRTQPNLISKTKILNGTRCLKSLYLNVHEPDLASPVTSDDQARFDMGTEVGIKAREFYPDGILVDNHAWDFNGALTRTRELIANGATTLYEAAFEYQGCYARLDIIQYDTVNKCWDVFEVKSSTKVKSEHITDASIQVWIALNAGLSVGQIHIMHINNQCLYPDLKDLFTVVDVTNDVLPLHADMPSSIQKMKDTLQESHAPEIDIGAHCEKPHDCSFSAHCWNQKQIPEESVFNLPRSGNKKWDLYREGIFHLEDQRIVGLNTLQQRIVNCSKKKQRYIEPSIIEKSLQNWIFPLVFLDFETINPAIPRYYGTRPYEQIPFQFSVHILQYLDSEVQHKEFLHDNTDDPRLNLIETLIEACGTEGSIIAYNATFEKNCIAALSKYSPVHETALNEFQKRIVDPLPIIQSAVYDPAFHGSFSLKKVAPALLGSEYNYDQMSVANGTDAQRAFEELIHADTKLARKEELKKAMLDYCKQDTYVLVELVKWLFKQIIP